MCVCVRRLCVGAYAIQRAVGPSNWLFLCSKRVNGICKENIKYVLKKSKSDVFTYYGMCTICDEKKRKTEWKKKSVIRSPFAEEMSLFFAQYSVRHMVGVFVPFPITIWNEIREENQCQCFYLSRFYCCPHWRENCLQSIVHPDMNGSGSKIRNTTCV